jgi:Sulfatase
MTARQLLWNGAHLAVLSAFALAQPLFNLLSDNPEFFAARGSTAFDIISFALLLVVVPPAILLLVEFLVGLASEAAAGVVHLVFVGLGFALVLLQAFKDLFSASDTVLIGLAVAAGVGAAVAYWRAEPVRSFLSVLSPVPLVFLVIFLFFSPVNKITLAGEADAKTIGGIARNPVVIVLFDELPSTSLLDERRRIDADRFPAFAELASDSTWFRNAYAVYDSTSKAIPAIMDGNLPEEGTLPTSSEHPNSIFTLLGNSHQMNVSEEATTVCPRDLCDDERLDESYGGRLGALAEDLGLVWLHVASPPDIEADLASVSETWGDFGGDEPEAAAPGDEPNTRANLSSNRRARFDAFVDSVERTQRPALNFKHVLLPHVPWEYLPSGVQYRRGASEAIPGLSNWSFEHQEQLDQLYLRHLLQLQFTDMELGKLFDRLKEEGIYDESLIVVAADHGVAFDLGERDRRRATRENFHEISPVPLIVKAPGQKEGRVSDSYVETIDIFPTIAYLLGVQLPDDTDGVSAYSREVKRRDSVRMLERDLSGWIRLSGEELERRKAEQLARKLELFGTGADGPDRLFRIGPHPELIGRDADSLPKLDVELENEGDYEDVDPASGYVPAHVIGRVGDGDDEFQDVAVAVNGTIVAVSRTFKLANGNDDEIFAAMVPESAFREGRNEVEVLEVL